MQPDPHLAPTRTRRSSPWRRRPDAVASGSCAFLALKRPRIADADARACADPLAHAQARVVDVLDLESADSFETEEKLDEAVVTFFRFAPNSYTGEDVVEVAAHGSPVILDTLLRQALAVQVRV